MKILKKLLFPLLVLALILSFVSCSNSADSADSGASGIDVSDCNVQISAEDFDYSDGDYSVNFTQQVPLYTQTYNMDVTVIGGDITITYCDCLCEMDLMAYWKEVYGEEYAAQKEQTFNTLTAEQKEDAVKESGIFSVSGYDCDIEFDGTKVKLSSVCPEDELESLKIMLDLSKLTSNGKILTNADKTKYLITDSDENISVTVIIIKK